MANNTGVLYGPTGTYKTWNLGLLAKYIFAKYKKPVRWVTADGGGYRPIQPFINAGIIIPYILTDDPQRMLMIDRIVGGYWPQDLVDGRRTSKKLLLPQSCTDIGGYIFEGMSSIAEALQRVYEGKPTGMKPAYSELIKSDLIDETGKSIDSITIGGYSQDSYGLIQSLMMKYVNFSWTLPVPYVWWSGHEASAEDDLTRKIVRGVKFVGNAATPNIGRNVGAMIHASRIETGQNEKGEKTFETRYYFQPHPDGLIKNVFWEAKPRISGDKVESLLESFEKGGYFVPSYEAGLDMYIAREEELLEESDKNIMEWKEKILKGE